MLVEDALLGAVLHVGDIFVGAQIDAIEQARIVALPPLAFSVGKCLVGVVGHAGFGSGGFAAKGRLVPPPCVLVMKGNADAHAGRVRGF